MARETVQIVIRKDVLEALTKLSIDENLHKVDMVSMLIAAVAILPLNERKALLMLGSRSMTMIRVGFTLDIGEGFSHNEKTRSLLREKS